MNGTASSTIPTTGHECSANRDQVRLIYQEHAITQKIDTNRYTTFAEPSWRLVPTTKPITAQPTRTWINLYGKITMQHLAEACISRSQYDHTAV